MSDALDVLRVAVAHGLPGASPTIGTDKGPPRLSSEVLSLAAQHRVQGLLWGAIEAGAIVGDDHLVEQARDGLTAALRTCLLAEETAVLALDALERAGIEARVLKGIAIAHLDHDSPSERVFGDADILIRRSDYGPALAALAAAGFVRAQPPVRGWWEKRFGKAIVLRAPSGAELDLHLAITGGYFGMKIDHDDLWSRPSDPFDLAGTTARGLDREGRFLHASCHTVLGGGSGLRAQQDVAQLMLVTGANWRQLILRTDFQEVSIVLAEAVTRTWIALRLDRHHPAAQWAAEFVPDKSRQRMLNSYNAAFDEGWSHEGRSMTSALNPLDRTLFLFGLAAPARTSLHARGRSRRIHMQLGIRTMLRRRGRASS